MHHEKTRVTEKDNHARKKFKAAEKEEDKRGDGWTTSRKPQPSVLHDLSKAVNYGASGRTLIHRGAKSEAI